MLFALLRDMEETPYRRQMPRNVSVGRTSWWRRGGLPAAAEGGVGGGGGGGGASPPWGAAVVVGTGHDVRDDFDYEFATHVIKVRRTGEVTEVQSLWELEGFQQFLLRFVYRLR